MSQAPEGPASPLDEVDFGALARQAALATEGLWLADHGTFLRDTNDDGAREGKLRPTVTCRCTEELLDCRDAALDAVPIEDATLIEMAKAVLGQDPQTMLGASELEYPDFTQSLIVATTAKAASAAVGVPGLADCAERARERLGAMAEELANHGGPEDDAHPFVVFHKIRALEVAGRQLEDPDALDGAVENHVQWVHAQTMELLAKHHLGTISPGESVVLAFCAATLCRRKRPEHRKAALAALMGAVAAQDSAGSWPLGRVVHTEPSRLEISTYEVAWAVTRSFQNLLAAGVVELGGADASALIDAISTAGMFAARSLIELEDISGWASDHPYQRQAVESWTSAIVLQFAIAAADLREDIRNRSVLQTFNIAHPDDALWPPWLRWDELREAEPDHEYPIYDYLEREVIGPIEADPSRQPSGRRECASVLLFGPPGTAKTTIVQAVADALGWPVVFLNPGVFIARGMEAIEAEAQSVFGRLQELRRAVVIFDECDELFRDRSPGKHSEQIRNISAFVTASMLPKLQDLHDKGRVVFFICTNHIDTMDPAVLRGGRIDHRIGVGPADRKARQRIVLEGFEPTSAPPFAEEALRGLADSAERFSRGELNRAARALMDRGRREEWADEESAREAGIEITKTMEDSLTIDKDAYDRFIKDRKRYSHPFIKKEALK